MNTNKASIVDLVPRAKRFWVYNLGKETWLKLNRKQRQELISSLCAFNFKSHSANVGLNKTMFTLVNIIHEELNHNFFGPLFNFVGYQINIQKVNNVSILLQLDIEEKSSWLMEVSKSLTSNNGITITLEQMKTILHCWNDPVANMATNYFDIAKTKFSKQGYNFDVYIAELSYHLHTIYPYYITYLSIKNNKVFQVKNNSCSWRQYLAWLRKIMGKETKYVLDIITTNLKINNTSNNEKLKFSS